jgi:hypothetical protein
MNKSLYELTDEFQYVMSLLEDPDEDPEVINDTLEAIAGNIEAKVDGYGAVIRNLEAKRAAVDAEAKRLANRRQTLDNRIARMKTAVTEAMRLIGKKKIDGNLFSFTLAQNGGKRPIVIDAELADIPANFVKISMSPDKDAIAEYLEAAAAEHVDCPWAHFAERGESLRIR